MIKINDNYGFEADELLSEQKPNFNVLHVFTQLSNGQEYEQTNTGKIRISFAAAYAGSIELLVYGRY